MRNRNMVGAAVLLFAQAFASGAQGHDFRIDTNGPVNDCSDVKFTIGDAQAFMAEQKLQVGGNALSLRLAGARGIPLKVAGSDRSGYELLLCKGAESAAALGDVRLEQKGNEVTLVGPDSEEWGGWLLVRAPRTGELDVESNNGPVSIDTIAGRLGLKMRNGPLSLKNVGGAVAAETKNGPVSFSGRGGDVKLTAQNGPMTINLEGAAWEGAGLQASTENGPLSLRIPASYGTGIVVDKGAHAPFRCPDELCGDRGRKFVEETLEIGSDPKRIHVSTSHGPLTIQNR